MRGFSVRLQPDACGALPPTCCVKKLSDWCRAHSVALTGHFYGDNSIYNCIQVTGDIFGCLDLMDVPGVDEIETHLSPDTELIFSQLKNAREHGAKHGMAELPAG